MQDADGAIRYIALRLAEEASQGAFPGCPAVARTAIYERAAALMGDPRPDVALAAAILIAKQRGASADDAAIGQARTLILEIVARHRKPEVPEDEQEAVELTGELGMKEAMPHLERRAWGLGRFVSETCAWHAKIALARMGHSRAVAEILRDLESTRQGTLSAAVVAAGRARLVSAKDRIVARSKDVADRQLIDDALAKLSHGA
jgi:hypothetical protein